MFNRDNCLIVAELSANHGGKLEIAIDTVKAARRSGADAIKLQTYTPDTITLDVKNEYFKIKQGTHWDGKYLHDLYAEASLPWEWHKPIFDAAAKEGLICFSSPFDKTAVDFLETLKVPAYKIASFEITDIPLIAYVATRKKPVIISTGIAGAEDIELALETCRKAGNDDITLLQCTSAYPAAPEDANLRMITDMKARFNVEVGLSDHTMGIEAPVVAVSLGAVMIEKHFILNKAIGGPDAHFSLDEKEFGAMVKAVRIAESMLGKADYTLDSKKLKSREFSRSLFVAENVLKGEVFNESNIRSVRPGFGMHPKFLNDVMGKKATRDLLKGTPLESSMISSNG